LSASSLPLVRLGNGTVTWLAQSASILVSISYELLAGTYAYIEIYILFSVIFILVFNSNILQSQFP